MLIAFLVLGAVSSLSGLLIGSFEFVYGSVIVALLTITGRIISLAINIWILFYLVKNEKVKKFFER